MHIYEMEEIMQQRTYKDAGKSRRHGKKRQVVILACCLALMLCLCACGDGAKEEVQEDNTTMVFRYGDNIVTVGEVYIYIRTVKERYELQYGEDVWQLSLPASGGDSVSMVDLTREAVVSEIVRVKTLAAHADEFGVTLTSQETSQLGEKANSFFIGLTDEDIAKMELTEDKIYQVFYENEIAGIVEARILEDNPVEISDETARMTTFYDMYFPCYSISQSGMVTEYSEEDKRQQYENALQACSTLATAAIDEDKDAENIEKLAEYYRLEQAKEQTLVPEEILEIYGEDIYNLLYAMENGDYSTVVETEYGYHVFQMIALTDPKATKSRKETMTAEAIEERLSSQMHAWQQEIDANFVYPGSVNMEVYDTIEITP